MLRFEFEGYNNLKDFCIQFVLDLGGAVEAAKALKAAAKKGVAEEEEPAPAKKTKKVVAEEEEPAPAKKTKKVVAEDEDDAPVKKAKAETEEDDGPTFDDVREALKKLMGTDAEDQIPVILADYGVEKISQLKKPQFVKVLKDFNKAIKGATPVSA